MPIQGVLIERNMNTPEQIIESEEHPTSQGFETSYFQATVFFPHFQVSSKHVYRLLPESWLEIFDDNPVMQPSFDKMPRDIPILSLSSQSNEWRCNISPARADIFWARQDYNSPPIDMKEFFDRSIVLHNELIEKLNLSVGRLAAVVHRFFKTKIPGLLIAEQFCKKELIEAEEGQPQNSVPLNRPESFELSAHKRFNFYDDLNVNSWIRNKTGIISPTQETIILVEQDLNSLSEELAKRNFSNQDIEKFFTEIIDAFDQILTLYYPDRVQS